MGRPAAHLDLEMQAAVVRGHDAIAEPGADREVRPLCLRQQPLRADLPARLLVVGDVQLDRAVEPAPPPPRAPAARTHRSRSRTSRRPPRGRTSSRPRSRHRTGRCVQPSPGGTTSPWALSAITGPAPKRRRTTRLTADHAVGADECRRHGVALDREAQALEQPAGAPACGAQSPGGLSDGTLTSSARKRSLASCWLAR